MDFIIGCFLTFCAIGIREAFGLNASPPYCLKKYQREKSPDPVCLCPLLKDYIICSLRQSEEDQRTIEAFLLEEHTLTAGRCDCLGQLQGILSEHDLAARNQLYSMTRVISYIIVLAALIMLYKLMSVTRLRKSSGLLLVLLYFGFLTIYAAVNKVASWIIISN